MDNSDMLNANNNLSNVANQNIAIESNDSESEDTESNLNEAITQNSSNLPSAHFGSENLFDATPTKKKRRRSSNPGTKTGSKAKSAYCWNFFSMETIDGVETGYAVCKCRTKYAYTSSTSAMNRHLKVCPIATNSSFLEITSSSGEGNLSISKIKTNKDLIDFILINEISYLARNYASFKSFIHNVNPKFEVPENFDVNAGMEERYHELKEKVSNFLYDHLSNSTSSRVSISLDINTTINEEICYVTISVYFIDELWQYRMVITAIPVLLFPFTESQLIDTLTETVLQWKLDSKLLCVTTDAIVNSSELFGKLQASSTESTEHTLLEKYLSNRCIISLLNNIVVSGLEHLSDKIDTLRSIVRSLALPKQISLFKEYCLADESVDSRGDITIPPLDLKYNWKSTYDMIDSALCFKSVIAKLSLNGDVGSISDSDWDLLVVLHSFLTPLVKYFQSIGRNDRPNIHVVLIQLYDLEERINQLISLDSEVKALGSALLNSYKTHFSGLNDLTIIAHILDPRYKLEYIKFSKGSSEYERCKNVIFSLYNDEYLSRVNFLDTSTIRLKPNTTSIFQFHTLKNKSMNPSLELSTYLEEPLIIDSSFTDDVGSFATFDILGYWKTYEVKYPVLSRLVKDILSIPATSLSNDSLFNLSIKSFNEYRSSLSPNQLEMLICSQNWIKLSTEID